MVAAVPPLPFLTRLWFSFVCFFRVLFDGAFAAKIYGLSGAAAPELAARSEEERAAPAETPKLEAKPAEALAPKAVASAPPAPAVPPAPAGPPPTDAALQLLALFQREGRLVDFLEEDVTSFSDADIGAAARVVHGGCRKALRDHVKLEPVRSEEEGAKVALPEGASPAEVKLTGNVEGKGPHTGTLRHRGWRAVEITLPTAVAGHDARIVAQAEVEL